MRKFSAAARISRPSRVDFRNQVVATRRTTLTRMVTSWRSCSLTPTISTWPASAGRKSTPFGREPTSMIIVFSMKKLTAKEAMSKRRRVGAAQGTEGRAFDEQGEQNGAEDRARDGERCRLREQQKHGIAGDHDQLRVSEVDQPHDAEDEADAERGKRIEAADADGVDQRPGRPARSWRTRSGGHRHPEIGGVEGVVALDLGWRAR